MNITNEEIAQLQAVNHILVKLSSAENAHVVVTGPFDKEEQLVNIGLSIYGNDGTAVGWIITTVPVSEFGALFSSGPWAELQQS